MKKIKIFFLPYAGASTTVYYAWKKDIAPQYELIFIDLPGHGSRADEKFCSDIDEAVKNIVEVIKSEVHDGDKYLIFGHSMGALLAYETYYKLLNLNLQIPMHIIVSGKNSPEVPLSRKIEKLEDYDFVEKISELGGLPSEFYNKEVMQIFLPILRSDFWILENYKYIKRNIKMSCDLTILFAKDDQSTNEEGINLWSNHTSGKCNFYEFSGNHFFIFECYKEVTNIINKILLDLKDK